MRNVNDELLRMLHSRRFQTLNGNKADNSHNTVYPAHTRDPLDGKVHGIKHGPCRACGHRKIISVASGLCGTQTCIKARRKAYAKRAAKRQAAAR